MSAAAVRRIERYVYLSSDDELSNALLDGSSALRTSVSVDTPRQGGSNDAMSVNVNGWSSAIRAAVCCGCNQSHFQYDSRQLHVRYECCNTAANVRYRLLCFHTGT